LLKFRIAVLLALLFSHAYIWVRFAQTHSPRLAMRNFSCALQFNSALPFFRSFSCPGNTDNMVQCTIPSLRDAVDFSTKFSARIWKKRSRERSESKSKALLCFV